MGACNSKIIPISTLPAPTDSRSSSYDFIEVVGHILEKDNIYNALKKEFNTYKSNTRAIQKSIQSIQFYKLTSNYYDNQNIIKERCFLLLKEAQKYGDNKFIQSYSDKIKSYENIYKSYLLYLYNEGDIVIDDDLLRRDDICNLFNIKRKKNKKKISFNL